MLLVTGGLDPLGETFSPVGEVWLYCTVLYCTALHCTALRCTILYYTILYYTIYYISVYICNYIRALLLYYTVLYCTVLYCTVLTWSSLESVVYCAAMSALVLGVSGSQAGTSTCRHNN